MSDTGWYLQEFEMLTYSFKLQMYYHEINVHFYDFVNLGLL